ncbi:Clp1/GlmU family protein [Thermodesulfatator autotrophicus]|uniref:Clp1 P-loop domain-containing protein n=1 Tax=Thermodesulfatator autotrophicus TaxID=1795632 RepID=A0A177E6B5_9BACT|nr:Clp1/GlmU family protein [Thermodesulfatator autotrophicus]OAG27435.1 hypothetical protein TH606_07130 [Thermodesulfatator autotrophicus]
MIDIPNSWEALAKEVVVNKPPKIILIGGVDVGKSTFSFYLLEKLLEAGIKAALLDADVGQKDVGPPTTIGLKHFNTLEELKKERPFSAERLYFVGSTTPVGHLLPLVVGTGLLAHESKAEVTVINTTGLIKGPGVALKTFKIENIKPDLIVAFQRERELYPILQAFKHYPVRLLEVSPKASPKTIPDRKKRREEAYQKYFSDNRLIELNRREISIQRPRKITPHLLCAP